MASNVGILLNDHHLGAKLTGAKRGRKAGRACANDNNVCVDIPSPNLARTWGGLRLGGGGPKHGDAPRANQPAAADTTSVFLICHQDRFSELFSR
jgi:hypothetical protein